MRGARGGEPAIHVVGAAGGRRPGAGRQVFEGNGPPAHGRPGGGTNKAPPLVHKWYEPAHHANGELTPSANETLDRSDGD